jgi:hypothetical protein
MAGITCAAGRAKPFAKQLSSGAARPPGCNTCKHGVPGWCAGGRCSNPSGNAAACGHLGYGPQRLA